MSNNAPARLAETPRVHHRTFPKSRHPSRSFVPLAEPAIDIQQVRKSFDGHVAVRDLSLQVPSRNRLRTARPQRRRQDHDDPHDPQHHRARLRHDHASSASPASTPTRCRSHRLSPRGARAVQEDAGPPRAALPRRAERRERARGGQAHRASGSSVSRSPTPRRTGGDAKVDELSRGMQQKVQFIGALLHEPDLVILDEPFSGLDPINAQALKDTIVELRAREDGHLQHARDGQRRAAVRRGVHHRARREGARRLDRVRQGRSRRQVHRRRARRRSLRLPSTTSSPTTRSWRRSTIPTAPWRSSWRPARVRSSCFAGSWMQGPSSSDSSSCSRRCTAFSSTRSAPRASSQG